MKLDELIAANYHPEHFILDKTENNDHDENTKPKELSNKPNHHENT